MQLASFSTKMKPPSLKHATAGVRPSSSIYLSRNFFFVTLNRQNEGQKSSANKAEDLLLQVVWRSQLSLNLRFARNPGHNRRNRESRVYVKPRYLALTSIASKFKAPESWSGKWRKRRAALFKHCAFGRPAATTPFLKPYSRTLNSIVSPYRATLRLPLRRETGQPSRSVRE
jgi:hypothetical protein